MVQHIADWEKFYAEGSEIAKKHGKVGDEEKYYVNKSYYGQIQLFHSTKLLSHYWDQCLQLSAKIQQTYQTDS